MKVIKEKDVLPEHRLLISERYEVKYSYIDEVDGYEKRGIEIYAGKRKYLHMAVEDQFKRDYPKATLISVRYQ